MDARVNRAFTPVFNGLCPRMTECWDRGLHKLLAPHIDRLLDPHQHADAGVRPDMGLLARYQQRENLVAHRTLFVQFDAAETPQEARLQHAVALRLEVGVHDTDALVVTEVVE